MLQIEKGKADALLFPRAFIPETTSNQSLVSLAIGGLDPAVRANNYKLTEHKVTGVSKQINRSHSPTTLMPEPLQCASL